MALFLDFDGTLSPIVEDPADAALLDGVGALVARLATRLPVAIVSGRGAEDVRGRVAVDAVHVAGSHGFEIIGPDGARHDHPDAAAAIPALTDVAARLQDEIGDVPGVIIEPKRFGLTVHDRMVADRDLDAVRAATEAAAAAHPELRITHGKRVTELRPAVDWDKGRAVEWLLARVGTEHPVAIYIGDDRTDEDAFAVLDDDALTVMVASADDTTRRTGARFRVEDPGQVRTLLERLAELTETTTEH